MSKLTLILLIKGRKKFTKRWLDYMLRIKYDGFILIGDGEKNSEIKKILKNKHYTKLNLKYVSYNHSSQSYKDYYYMMYDLVRNHVKTEFIRFCDNDDFILKNQQTNLLNYYIKNKNLASVGDFQIRFEILNQNKLHGNKIYFFLEGVNRSQDSFSNQNIRDIFNNYQGFFYNIFKKKDMQKILFEIYKLNFTDLEIRDFYLCLRLICNGKTIYLNQSSYIRQHATSQTSTNFFYSDNFFSKDIKGDTEKLVTKISKIFEKKFNINQDKMKELIFESYKSYLNKVIAHNKRVFLYPKYFKFRKYLLKKFTNLVYFIRIIQNLRFNLSINKLYKKNKSSFNQEFSLMKKFIRGK